MVIDLTPEVEAHLEQIAQHEGKSVQSLILDAAVHLHHEDLRFQQGVEEGLAQADAGDFVDDTEMQALWQRLLQRS